MQNNNGQTISLAFTRFRKTWDAEGDQKILEDVVMNLLSGMLHSGEVGDRSSLESKIQFHKEQELSLVDQVREVDSESRLI
jgi:hypothetical protein